MSAMNVAELLCITPLLLAIRKLTTRRKPSPKGVLLGGREAAPGRSPTHVMSVGKALLRNQVLQNVSKFMLERDPINVRSVGRPLFEGQSSRNIWESMVGGLHKCAECETAFLGSTGFIQHQGIHSWERPTSVSVARPSDRGQTLVSPENSW